MTTEHQDKRHKETDTTTTKENPTENLCWWCNPTIRFSFFLVLFTGALVVVGFLQWRAVEKTDLTSRLRDRAFINFSDPIREDFPNYDPPRLTFNVIVQNTGNVPARDVSISCDFMSVNKSQNIIDPFPIAKFSLVPIPRFIGPKQAIKFRVCDETEILFNRIINGEIDVFIVIKADYLDGFDPIHPRTTQMSRQLHVDKAKLHSLSFAGPHNCIDEDCR